MSLKKRLRALIAAPEILVMPGVFDGYSARIIQEAGFHCGFVTGGGVSEAALGWADVGVMSFEENLRVVRALVGCFDLPLFADADTGYGNAVNVHFTVRGFERAGVAGIMIEDQTWPKRCGHLKGKDVIPADEAAQKIRAATQARMDPDLVIMSRTDALATHGLDEAINRLNLYAEAGADLLFADALLSVDDITQVVSRVSKPLIVNMGFGIQTRNTTPLLSAKQLERLGVAGVIYPRLLTAAAVRGMRNAMSALQQSLTSGEVVERPDLLVSFEDLNELMGLGKITEMEQSFLTSDQLERKYSTAKA
jgi:2-methylisocitrate lyase-like PEP mutase family enzyme